MAVITQEARQTWRKDSDSIKMAKVQNLQKPIYLSNLYILKSFQELKMLFIEKSKYRVGAEKRKKH